MDLHTNSLEVMPTLNPAMGVIMKRKNNELLNLLAVHHQKKRETNPAYSLRALSRDIGLPQPVISLFMRGKRRLTAYMAYKIGVYLKLDNDHIYRIIVVTFEDKVGQDLHE